MTRRAGSIDEICRELEQLDAENPGWSWELFYRYSLPRLRGLGLSDAQIEESYQITLPEEHRGNGSKSTESLRLSHA